MGLFFPWAVWITVQIFKSDKAIALNTANDAKIWEELTKIYFAVDNNQKSTNQRFDKMEHKMDLFIAQELSFLKQVASKL